jgi:hypothetical protein
LTPLIDDVARVMTDAAPPAELRRAVLASIDRRRPARFWWFAAPVAAAALVVIAIGLRRDGTNSGVASPVPALARSTPAASAGSPAAGGGDTGDSLLVPARPRRQPVPVLQVRTIRALNEPAALDRAGIQPDGLDIPLLQLKPIVAEPIAIRVIGDDAGGRE